MSMALQAAAMEAALVSRRCGLVSNMAPQSRGPEEPATPHLWTATLAHFDFRAAPRRERLNAGKGRSEAEARLAALGEAVERYSAYHWDARRVRVGRAAPDCITPAECVLYAEDQYDALPYARWTPETETSWIDGVDLATGRRVEAPAALVYLVGPAPRPEDRFAAVTSNGLSAGLDLESAILGGLHEAIERDALMIAWLNRLPATLIETPERGCVAADVIRHYRWFGVTVRLFLLPTDQAARVVLAVADNPPGEGPARVVGMGCDADPARAVDKAVFELCQARPSEAARFRESDPSGRLRRYEDVRELDDHPGFHAIAAHGAEFDFLSEGGRRVALDDLPAPAHAAATGDALRAVVARLVETGARAAYVEITAPDVAAAGWRVVRAIATGLQPIHFGHGEARLGGRRLFEAPAAWGLRASPSRPDALNRCPHPLA